MGNLFKCEERSFDMFLQGNKVREFVEYKSTALREEYQLNVTELKMIMYLSSCDGHDTLSDIGSFLEANKGYMSQKIKGLIERGFVTSCPDENDRRYVHYALTEEAMPIAEAFIRVLIEVKDCLIVGITPEEGAAFESVVNKIVSNAEREMNSIGKSN